MTFPHGRRMMTARMASTFPTSPDSPPSPVAVPAARRRNPFLLRRGGAALLALAVEFLLALLLLGLVPALEKKAHESQPVSFVMSNGPEQQDSTQAKAGSRTRATQRAPEQPPSVPPPPVPPTPVPKPETASEANIRWITHNEFAASSLANARSTARAAAPAPAGNEGNGVADSMSVGNGPNGEVLYQAEWYTRPTDAQLNTYVPANMRTTGWGLIACRTIAGYRVEDCREMGEFPPGSGYGRAARQAAWQFRVRPPMRNRRPLVGSWVRIRIDYVFHPPGEEQGADMP